MTAFLLMLCITLVFSQPILAVGSEEENPTGSVSGVHEVILLFDTGESMSRNDPATLGPDALRQIASSLPADWHVGLITFQEAVREVVPPGRDTRGEIYRILGDVSYANAPNPGAGLLQAVESFSSHTLSRTIIFLTDGQNADMSEEAANLAEQAIDRITASDIRVHKIAVGENVTSALPIMGLAHATNGLLLRDIRSEDLSRIASTLVFDTLGVARSPQMRGGAGSFSVYIPAMGLDSASIFITAESEITDIVVAEDIGQVSVQTGERFALIEIANPTSQTFNIAFAAYGYSSADLIMEWDLRLMSDGSRFWFADRAGSNALLNPFFERRVFPISTDASELHLEGGYVHWNGDEEELFRLLQMQLAVFGINIPNLVQDPTYAPPTPPADQPEDALSDYPAPPDEQPTDGEESAAIGSLLRRLAPIGIGVVSVLALALVVILLVSRFKRSTPKTARPQGAASGGSELVFAGKLDLYVIIGTIEDYKGDMKPRTFKVPQGRVSVQAMLKKCKLSNTFPGSGQIYFKATDQGALQITNGSDCAIYVGSDTLVKNQPYVLRHKENVRIRDVYDVSELVISPRFLFQA